MTQLRLMPVASDLYILQRGATLIQILVEHPSLLFQRLRRHFLVSQKPFCLRDMIETT